ncbi:MAG TPA: alpha/beta hydrolase [Methylomirabilota bacterium]|jgi:pimeloyl-ACP methyl ester carboxylesterase
MPAVFVHGVPDTHRVWQAVVGRLRRRDVVTLSLPGFDCELPPGFDGTKEAYADWLLAELRRVDGPIDLIGHDWGGLLVVRAVSLEPALVRTWTAGGAPLDPDYEWHKAAQLWQTPGVGEQVMDRLTPDTLTAALVAAAVPAADAARTAEHLDATMKRSILALYRSAVRVGTEWEADLQRAPARGLLLWGENDPYAAPAFGRRLAERTRARFVELAGCGHWWQLERPNDVAKELEGHWS